MAAKLYKNLIGGEWVDSRSGKSFENQNPANTKDVVGIFPRSNRDDVNEAVEAAKQAFERWRLTLAEPLLVPAGHSRSSAGVAA